MYRVFRFLEKKGSMYFDINYSIVPMVAI